MFLHYSGLSSKSTSLLFEFVNPARGQNSGGGAQLSSVYSHAYTGTTNGWTVVEFCADIRSWMKSNLVSMMMSSRAKEPMFYIMFFFFRIYLL